MIVYEARYYGGEYEDKFDNSLGIYDDLQVAEWECLQAMERFQKSTWDDVDYIEHKETRCFYINEWKVNIGMLEKNIRVWYRRKDGKFFDIPEEVVEEMKDFVGTHNGTVTLYGEEGRKTDITKKVFKEVM